MSTLSLKTVVVHKDVTSLMTETSLQKGGLVHRVPYISGETARIISECMRVVL